MALRIRRSRLPALLKSRRMTQAELARRIDVSEPFITQIINLSAKFSLVKAKETADIFGCYIDDLYEWDYD